MNASTWKETHTGEPTPAAPEELGQGARADGDTTRSGAVPATPRIAYLVSQYPAISHTFILREIRHLRARGLDIEVMSVNGPDRGAEDLTAEERDEAAKTVYLKRQGVLGAARAHLWMLCNRPLDWLGGLEFAATHAGSDDRRLVYMFFYFLFVFVVH